MAENTIAENLQRLINAKSDISDAIIAKGGTVGSNDGFEEFAADIATIPTGGGGGVSPNDVNFYDYDGTIVHSYSANDFANLSELPPNPSHDGLTSQGWNWSLTDAKAHVASYNRLNIGQMYITSDGKTRIYITLSEGRTSPILQLYLNNNSELDIDWGDGSTHSTFTSNTAGYKNERHIYANTGEYVIAITVVNGEFILRSSSTEISSILWNGNDSSTSPDRAYVNSIKKVEIGGGVTSIGYIAFLLCYSLSSITIPNSVTSIGTYALAACYSLSSITIPNSVTSIGTSALAACYSLSSTSITIPINVTSIINDLFSTCYSLSSITIPNSVTSIGTYAFRNCYSLSSITIPNNVTSIGPSAFLNCYSLSFIKFKPITPPTVFNSNAWDGVSTSTFILTPVESYNAYKTGTNYPNPAIYTYLAYGTYISGDSLPSTTSDNLYNLTWYASLDDATSRKNPITVGNGNEVYARATIVNA